MQYKVLKVIHNHKNLKCFEGYQQAKTFFSTFGANTITMKRILLIVLALISFNITSNAQQNDFLNDLINLWNNKKFDKVFLPLKEYKESNKISGDFEIDYMIATSASRSNQSPSIVSALFADLTAGYTFKSADEDYVQKQATPARYEAGKNPRMDNEYIANRGKAGDKTSADVPKPLGKIELQKIEAQKQADVKKKEAAELAEKKKKEAADLAQKKKLEAEAKKAAAKMKADSIAAAKTKAIASVADSAAKTETQEITDYNNPAPVDKKTDAKKTDAKTAATTAKKEDGKKTTTTVANTKDKMVANTKDKSVTKNNDDIIRKPGVTQIVKGDRIITVKAGYTYIVRTDSIFEMPPPTAKKPMGSVASPVKK